MSQTSIDLEKVKAAAVANIKLSFEEVFKPHLAKMLEEKLREQWEHPPYRLAVGKNVTIHFIADSYPDTEFRCKHGNIVLESDDCPQCAQEQRW